MQISCGLYTHYHCYTIFRTFRISSACTRHQYRISLKNQINIGSLDFPNNFSQQPPPLSILSRSTLILASIEELRARKKKISGAYRRAFFFPSSFELYCQYYFNITRPTRFSLREIRVIFANTCTAARKIVLCLRAVYEEKKRKKMGSKNSAGY